MSGADRRRLSVCIITRDEERNLAACLAAVAFADEIVVVDSQSTDATRDIATARGCRVVVQPFLGHVKQKQFAVDQASFDWVFCVDADERVDDALRAAIEAAMSDPNPAAGYEVNRHTFHLGAFIDHGGWFPEWRLRLFDRRRGGWRGVDPHDHVEVHGEVRRLAGELQHFAYRDLEHHLAKIDSYTTIMAREKASAGRSATVFDLLLRPPARFLKMFVLRCGFRDGVRGLILATLGGYYVFLKYAKLWERERVKRGASEPPA
jgi:glycosyltransferase involved in cell wall biosynthesis